MEFHVHRRIVWWTRIAVILVSAFPHCFLPLTAPASCLIRSQLQLRRLYFNWVDLPHAVLSVGRPAQASQFPLLTLCFAPTLLRVGYPAGSEQPNLLLLSFSPPMLPVCGLRALNEVRHRHCRQSYHLLWVASALWHTVSTSLVTHFPS